VVLPLAAPDLPVIVWSRSARLFEMPPFGAIARMAAKVVVDSAGFADPKRTLRVAGGDSAERSSAGRPGVDPADAVAGDSGAAVRESGSFGEAGGGLERASRL